MKIGVGKKIAGGFGVLIALSAALGGLAIYNMLNVKDGATSLSKEFVPEVRVANSVERNAFETMYGLRGYVYTEDQNFLDSGLAAFQKTSDSLKEALDLASKSAALGELDKNAKSAKEAVEKYGKLLEKMIAKNKTLADAKKRMNDDGAAFASNVNLYTKSMEARQDEELEKNATIDKLKERTVKIRTANDLENSGFQTRVDAWKAIAARSPEQFKKAISNLDNVDSLIESIKKITVVQANMETLNKIKAAVDGYRDAMDDFLKAWNEREEIAKDLRETGRAVLGLAQKTSEDGMVSTQKVADSSERSLGMASNIMLAGLAFALLVGVIFAWAITVGILKPVNRSAEIANVLASQSEELSTVSGSLVSASEEMSSQANNVSAATEQMSANINAMASASEQMNVNAQSVASASEQMSRNVANVAGAIEELSASMSMVGEKARTGATVANEAMKTSSEASGTMNQLGMAAQEIGQVTEVIKRIAEQTNLLALNATIEAASAGDAGRGFAVVANEIKELANQSAQAAEDIAKRIRGVQGKTDEAVKAISQVSVIIAKLNEASEAINALVSEQAKATNDMASNVAEANTGVNSITASIKEVAEGTREMSRNAGEAAKGAGDVSSNIGEVKVASTNTSSNASQVNVSAGELAKLAGELKQITMDIKGQ